MLPTPAATQRQSDRPSSRDGSGLASSDVLDSRSPVIKSFSDFGFRPSIFGLRVSAHLVGQHPILRRLPGMKALGVVTPVLAYHFKKAGEVLSISCLRTNHRQSSWPWHLKLRVGLH